MTLNRFAGRRDDNEAELVDTARRCGAQWFYGPPLDGWIWHAKTGWVPVEIKAPRGRYTEAQLKFLERCEAAGAVMCTWRSVDDVLKFLGAK